MQRNAGCGVGLGGYQRTIITYLDPTRSQHCSEPATRTTWLGRRDRALLLLALQTGLRVSEITGLGLRDLALERPAHVRAHGKGRKDRAVTLTHETVAVLRPWVKERHGQPDDPVFCTRQGQPLSRDTVALLLTKHADTASTDCPSLHAKHITPHGLRHTNAMLLKANHVDVATIALWLGHESTRTTHIYEHADPAIKDQSIARTAPLGTKPGRYRPTDTLLAFLQAL